LSKLKREVTIMLDKQVQREEEFSRRLKEEIELAQEEAFHRVLDQNAAMKDNILKNFKQKLGSGTLSPEEQTALMADMNAKMALISDALESEQDAQNRALNEALLRRRAK